VVFIARETRSRTGMGGGRLARRVSSRSCGRGQKLGQGAKNMRARNGLAVKDSE
jgi:hypothetical protein